MLVRALAPWYGSKRTLAPSIVRQLGAHRIYWEPFAGGLAVLFAKRPAASETCSDLHGDVMNCARVVQNPAMAPKLYQRLAGLLVHENSFEAAALRLAAGGRGPANGPDADLARAADYLTVSWMGRSGVAGTMPSNTTFAALYDTQQSNLAVCWRRALDSIPAWYQRLQAVTFLTRDALEILPQIRDRPGVAVYCDPPYLQVGRRYLHPFGLAAHRRLALELGRFRRARVVVSGYDDPELRRLYRGWQRVEVLGAQRRLTNQNGRGQFGPGRGAIGPEVLLVNGELIR